LYTTGFYSCGPCPVEAIKNGDVNVGFDGSFIYAEVNGDVVHWLFNPAENKYDVNSVKKSRYVICSYVIGSCYCHIICDTHFRFMRN